MEDDLEMQSIEGTGKVSGGRFDIDGEFERGSSDSVEDEGGDDEGEDEDEDDEESDKEIDNLEVQLATNTVDYHLHLQYVNALRRKGELEKLRKAREAMSGLFPLTPAMWLEWTNDETRLLTNPPSAEAIASVEELYERGVKDYLSIRLWLAYIEFLEEVDPSVAEMSPEGLAKIRQIFERGLSAGGLHLSEGCKLWISYRELEMAVLTSLEDAGSSEDAKKKQAEQVRRLFRRHLGIPHEGHEDTLKEYKAWEQNQVGSSDDIELPASLAATYKRAKLMYEARIPYEAGVAPDKSEDEKLMNYLKYVEFEEATKEPARVQVLYERTVTAFPIHSSIWLKYIDFLDNHLKVPVVIRNVYSRAVRNCPWVGILWTRYLLALERTNASEDEIFAIFEKSLQSGIQTPEEYLCIFLTRVDGLRRRISSSVKDEDIGDVTSLLRSTFNRAVEFLGTYFPDFCDRTLQLHSYWANLEAKLLKDLAAARTVWETLLKAKGWMVEAWLACANMELDLGEVGMARAVYKRCYNRRFEGSGTEVVYGAWLRFEREYGTLEDYDTAMAKVAPRLNEVRALEQKQGGDWANNISVAHNRGQMKSPPAPSAASENKRKRGLGHEEPRGKASKRTKSEVSGLGDRVSRNVKEPVASSHKPKKSIGNVKDEADVEMEGAQTKDIEGGDLMGEEDEERKPVVYTDECTAFVSSLPFGISQEEVESLFQGCGDLQEVRLVKDRNSNLFKGIAYIQFGTEKALEAAIAMNKQRVHGRPIRVQQSNPDVRSQRGGRGGGGRGSFSGRDQEGEDHGREKKATESGGGREGSGRGREGSGRGRGRSGGGRGGSGGGRGGSGGGREGSGGRGGSTGRGWGEGTTAPPTISHRRGGHLQLMGRSTFAVPRNVALAGSSSAGRPSKGQNLTKGQNTGGSHCEEKPLSSNEAFRKELLKD